MKNEPKTRNKRGNNWKHKIKTKTNWQKIKTIQTKKWKIERKKLGKNENLNGNDAKNEKGEENSELKNEEWTENEKQKKEKMQNNQRQRWKQTENDNKIK